MPALHPAEQYAKEIANMRGWLDAKPFHMALDALEFGRELHCGLRKDNVTPEFAHQIFIANYLRTLLPGIRHQEETLAAVFLHDVCEDFDVGFEEIESKFGPVVGRAVRLLTKKHRGVVVPYETYFRELATCPVASLVKGTDRAHNVFTMAGANWTIEKQEAYLDEVERWFLPMLKEARRRFRPEAQAFFNVRTLLKVQSAHIRLGLDQGRRLRALEEESEHEAAPAFG